jgi:quinol monooxygenase YgiN
MSTPFMLITTHRIKPGQLDAFHALAHTYEEFVHANEPDLLAYYTYIDADHSEASLVQIHRNEQSAEHHMTIAAELIGQGLTLADTVRVEIYGTPGPIVEQARAANAAANVQVSAKPRSLGGFSR